MRIAVNIVRVFLGLLFLASSVTYFLDLVPAPEMEGDILTFNEGLMASRYLFPLVKTVELVVAIAFLSGRFVPLAVVLLFPVTVNIFLVHLFLDPGGLPLAIVVLTSHLFLAFACWAHFQKLLAPRIEFSHQPPFSEPSGSAAENKN